MDARVTENPKPSKGQVWRVTGGNVERVVNGASEGFVRFTVGDYHHAVHVHEFVASGVCVGIETPAGRVMVGEQRQPARGIEYRVHHVADGDTVWVEDGVYGYGENARAVASWPLLPPLAQPPLTSDTVRRPSGCRCQWEQGDSECAVHPTCAECGGVVCECKPKGPMSKRAEKSPKNPYAASLAELKAIWDPAPSRPDLYAAHRERVMGNGREGGVGIARLDIDIPKPTIAPDVVHTWEGWALP